MNSTVFSTITLRLLLHNHATLFQLSTENYLKEIEAEI